MPSCCCAEWVAGLAKDHARRLAAVARREGLRAGRRARRRVQDALHALIARVDARALRDRPDEAARVLVAIVRNTARNARRRHHRAKPHVDVELASSVPAPDAVLDEAETRAQLAGCMAGLAELHRSVVTLRVLEELSGDEAARALGLTPGHVAVLLHRARKQLARCMTDVS